MDGYDFYYKAKTKVNVFLQDVVKNKGKKNSLLHQFLLSFIASGETPTRRTVTLEERVSFPLH